MRNEWVVDGNGHRVHVVRAGAGFPVVCLHGWPGYWYDYRHVLPALAGSADVVAVDLRGFGESDKPATGYDRAAQAHVVEAVLDSLGLRTAILIGYDIGSAIAVQLARQSPSRVAGLVLGAPLHPGSGARSLLPDHQAEFWYQDFHRLPLAADLIDGSPAAVRTYLDHFYRHWAATQPTPSEMDTIAAAYAAPGAFAASIAWYRAGAATVQTARDALTNPAPPPPPLPHPTEILWGEEDPLFPPSWSEGLETTFASYRLHTLPHVGHFIPWEAPLEVAAATRRLLQPPNEIDP